MSKGIARDFEENRLSDAMGLLFEPERIFKDLQDLRSSKILMDSMRSSNRVR